MSYALHITESGKDNKGFVLSNDLKYSYALIQYELEVILQHHRSIVITSMFRTCAMEKPRRTLSSSETKISFA